METETKRELDRPQATMNTSWLIFRFVSGWLLSLAILAGLALMVNIDWAKPKMQEVMGQALHRPVKLGHLRWFFGLNGITLTTKNIEVTENDGDPFLKAKGINIGVAFTPLLSGKVVLKHLRFDTPEFYAVKLKASGWNFEDLLVETTEIHFVQVDNGKVHVIDATKEATNKTPFTLSDVNLKFNWPTTGKKLPVYLALALPNSDKNRSADIVRIEGFTVGQEKDFLKTRVNLNISARDVHAVDLKRLLAIVLDDKEKKALLSGQTLTKNGKPSQKPPEVDGLIGFKMDLNGDLARGFQSNLTTDIKNLVVQEVNMGKVKAGKVETDGSFKLNDKEISWQDFNFKVGGIALSTRGALSNWQGAKPSYKLDLQSRINDLSVIKGAVDLSQLKDDKENNSLKALSTKMSGKAFFQINVTGMADQAKLLTKMEMEGLPIAKIVQEIAPELAPYMAMSGITADSRIKGHFEAHPGRKLKIHQGQIAVPDSLIKVEGEVDLLRDEVDIKFDLDQVSLRKIWNKALDDPETVRLMREHLDNTHPRDLLVEGVLKASGTFKKNKRGLSLNLLSALKAGSFSTRDKTITTDNIQGKFELKDGNLKLTDVEGKLGSSGRFSLTGSVKQALSKSPNVDVAFYGNNVEFNNLGRVMTLFGFDFPAITEGHLTGRVKELSIKVAGTPRKPSIFLSASPEDIEYRPPGLSRSLKAVSGSIVFAGDKISLSDVDIVSRGMKLTTSLVIEELSGIANLKNFHVKSDGIDIADIDYYLTSPVLPKPLRQQYKDFLKTYKISNLHGRIYGDLVVEPRPGNDLNIEGVIGCYSVGALVGEKGSLELPLERIAGIIAASGDELLIQDLSGSLRSSEFQLNGSVKDYKSKKPSWKTEFKSTFAPNELLDLVPRLTKNFSKGKLEIFSQGPLVVRAQIQGNPDKNQMVFNSHAAADSRLKISSPYFVINQPRDEELNLDGSLTIDKAGLNLHNTNLLLGEAALKAQGQWSFVDDTVSLSILSPNPVPAKTLVGLVDNNLDTKNMQGTVDGFISMEGPIKHPKLTGKISLDRVSNKDFQLYDLNGSISTDNLNASKHDPYSISVARLDIDRMRFRKLRVQDIGGLIEIQVSEPTNGDLPAPPKFLLKDITARTAGGHIKMDGHFDTEKNGLGVNIYLSQIHMEEIVDRLFDAPDELTGALDGELHITTHGTTDKQMVSNMEGTGNIVIQKGIVARFGQLQTKLTQANLLSQGILGFNINNLLQSVAPARSGEFNELTSRFQIFKGALAIKELRFSGDDLRLWGAGAADLSEQTIDLEIAGTLPRVTESFLGGTIGRLSRNITVSGLLSKVTFGALENLPSLPILGDIASDKPRAFAFKVQAPAQDAKLVAKSIEKTFRFLPNKQAASAHPVPGL